MSRRALVAHLEDARTLACPCMSVHVHARTARTRTDVHGHLPVPACVLGSTSDALKLLANEMTGSVRSTAGGAEVDETHICESCISHTSCTTALLPSKVAARASKLARSPWPISGHARRMCAVARTRTPGRFAPYVEVNIFGSSSVWGSIP